MQPCDFCTFSTGRAFNILYHGSLGDFDKLDISMERPYLTRIRKGRQLSRRPVKKCPQCGRYLL
jgi:hypothetical protein